MIFKILKEASAGDIRSLALIHEGVLKESIVGRFGFNFLQMIYKIICSDRNNIIIAIISKNRIVGYCIATTDISKFYKKIFLKNIFILSVKIVKNLGGNIKILLSLVIWAITPQEKDKYPAELQFLAILPKYQRLGLGTKLISLLKEEYTNHNILFFKVGTKAENINSNNFYKKIGFKYLYQKKMFGERFNYYLTVNNIT